MARIQTLTLLLASVLPCLGRSGYSQHPLRQSAIEARTNSPFTDDFGTFVDSVLSDFKVPGLSVAVVDRNHTFSHGYGFATLPDVKATPETLWFGASTTKAFVAATLSQFIQNKSYPALAEDGWGTPIASIIPDDFVLADDWATKHSTLDDAVCHRTGLPRHDYTWQYTTNGSHTPIRDVVRSLRHLPLTAEPRTVHQYNNLMYMVLSHVIETLTKKPLQTTFRELIWGPLKMNSTFLDVAEAKASPHHLATGYHWNQTSQSYGAIVHDTLQESGAAGIITNVLDHAKWMRSLLTRTGPLSSDTHDDIRRPRIISAEPASGTDYRLYGLGWDRTVFHGEPLYRHIGEALSFGTTLYWLPKRNYGVVAMANVYKQGNIAGEVVVRRLVEDAMGIPDKDRFDRAKAGKELLETLDGEFAKAPEDVYGKLPQKTVPPPVALSKLEGEYFDAGYGRLVFKLSGNNGSQVLIAERPETVYQYNVRLQHVSANDWVAFFESRIGSRLPAQYFGAHFKTDNSTVSALDINFVTGQTGTKNYNVTFNKIA
ncbi:penicillin-binding protein, putative [Cordyceps militaris]|uniref:Penicillin-binding protein, putative n=1 Tax=Cordyceps militaris TaxID=73501 RepID=A0A2H4SJD6_CORMI|nr:penicillin-binding protein, putative [Cordyceps militaris]